MKHRWSRWSRCNRDLMNSRHSPIPSHTSVVSGIGRYSSTNQTSSPYFIVFTVRPIKHLCCAFVCEEVQPIKHLHPIVLFLQFAQSNIFVDLLFVRMFNQSNTFTLSFLCCLRAIAQDGTSSLYVKCVNHSCFVKSQSPQCSVTEPNHAKHTLILRCLKIMQCQALSVRSIVGGTVAHEVFFQLQQLYWVWSETSRSLRTTYTWSNLVVRGLMHKRNENNIGIFSSFCCSLVVISNDRWDLEFVTCGCPG